MPPWDRAVDSISSSLDKHDCSRRKVDTGNLSSCEGDADSSVSLGQGARQRGALRPAERVTLEEERDRLGARGGLRGARVCKLTQMLDNSRGELGEQRQDLATHTRPQKTGIAVGWIIGEGNMMPFEVSHDIGPPGANQRPNEVTCARDRKSV